MSFKFSQFTINVSVDKHSQWTVQQNEINFGNDEFKHDNNDYLFINDESTCMEISIFSTKSNKNKSIFEAAKKSNAKERVVKSNLIQLNRN